MNVQFPHLGPFNLLVSAAVQRADQEKNNRAVPNNDDFSLSSISSEQTVELSQTAGEHVIEKEIATNPMHEGRTDNQDGTTLVMDIEAGQKNTDSPSPNRIAVNLLKTRGADDKRIWWEEQKKLGVKWNCNGCNISKVFKKATGKKWPAGNRAAFNKMFHPENKNSLIKLFVKMANERGLYLQDVINEYDSQVEESLEKFVKNN